MTKAELTEQLNRTIGGLDSVQTIARLERGKILQQAYTNWESLSPMTRDSLRERHPDDPHHGLLSEAAVAERLGWINDWEAKNGSQ